MRKLKRFLSLFLASSLLMGLNVQAMPVEKTDTDIAKLEIEVNGEGKVTIDDGHSKYFLENKDVFRADCTVDTNLKITATPNEGYYIASVDGIDSNGISDGNSKIYDVNLQENKTSITINFLEEKKEVFIGIGTKPACCNHGYGQQMLQTAYENSKKLYSAKPLYLEV